MKESPPVYRKLVNSMAFDPDKPPETAFEEWDLDRTHPPTVGELIKGLTDVVQPALIPESTLEGTDE